MLTLGPALAALVPADVRRVPDAEEVHRFRRNRALIEALVEGSRRENLTGSMPSAGLSSD